MVVNSGSVPTRVAPVTMRSATPLLVTVTFWLTDVVPVVAEPKSSEVGATAASGPGRTPVPLSGTTEGDPAAL